VLLSDLALAPLFMGDKSAANMVFGRLSAPIELTADGAANVTGNNHTYNLLLIIKFHD
jgi:hypothetical protein